MNIASVSTDVPLNTEQLKRTGAAKDFEALLIGQMLHSVRAQGSGWLDSGEDQSSDAAFGLGEKNWPKPSPPAEASVWQKSSTPA